MGNSYLKIIEVKDEVVLYNFTNGMTMQIHKDVYELIKNCISKSDIMKIAGTRPDSDNEFFDNLGDVIEKNNIFTDCSSNKIKEISYVLTDKCNLHCKHCCMSAKTYSKNSNEKIILDPSIIKKIVNFNPSTIILTGGEPLVADNFLDILMWLKDNYHNQVFLSTNAILIDKDNVDCLCKAIDIFDISLDGLTAEKSDKIRGTGTFDKVIESIKLLQKAGAKKIRLSNALSAETKDDSALFHKMCKEIGVEPIIRYMTPTGRAKDNNLCFSDELIKFKGSAHFTPSICGAGVTSITVDSSGNVYPCNNFIEDEYKIGNVLSDDIQEVINNYRQQKWFKNFSRYLPNYRSECKDCEVSQYCWTCPFEIKLLEESKGIKDLFTICGKKKQELMKVFDHE